MNIENEDTNLLFAKCIEDKDYNKLEQLMKQYPKRKEEDLLVFECCLFLMAYKKNREAYSYIQSYSTNFTSVFSRFVDLYESSFIHQDINYTELQPFFENFIEFVMSIKNLEKIEIDILKQVRNTVFYYQHFPFYQKIIDSEIVDKYPENNHNNEAYKSWYNNTYIKPKIEKF